MRITFLFFTFALLITRPSFADDETPEYVDASDRAPAVLDTNPEYPTGEIAPIYENLGIANGDVVSVPQIEE